MPLECFYTLPDSLEEYRIIWRIEPQLCDRIHLLRQKIDPLAELNEETLEAIIARSLFEELQQNPERDLIRKHWIAFLERRCEQVASKILYSLPVHFRSAYFRDLFLIGCEAVRNLVNFFNNFDNRRSPINYWYPTLKKFCDTKIKHLLIPKLKKITGLETIGITNLGLVARSSRKRVKEALQQCNYSEAKLSQYLLAWQCFQEVRNSLDLGVNKFKPEHFNQVAERYCEFKKKLALHEVQERDVNEEEIKTWLGIIGTAIRQLLDPPLDSLDTLLYSRSDEETYLIDNLPSEPKLDDEMNRTVTTVRKFIAQLLNELEEIAEKQTLFLKYGLEMNQSQVGKELGGQPQYQVCRNLQKLHNRILSQICDWVRQNLELEPSSEGLNELEGVLYQYYSDQIDCFFERTIQFLQKQSQEMLKLFYIAKIKPLEMGNQIHKSEAEVKELLEAIRQWLYSSMTEQIQAKTKIQFQPQGVAEKRITAITEIRLETILPATLTTVNKRKNNEV